jgi:hypothetical protein
MEFPKVEFTIYNDWERYSIFSSIKSGISLDESEKEFIKTGEDF